jgi:hypothetical protein
MKKSFYDVCCQEVRITMSARRLIKNATEQRAYDLRCRVKRAARIVTSMMVQNGSAWCVE